MALIFSLLGPYIKSLHYFIAFYEIKNYKHEYQFVKTHGKKLHLSTFVNNTYHELVKNTWNLCILLKKED